MLRIRPDQFAAMEGARTDEANLRLADYARSRFPDQHAATPTPELVELVVAVRRRARDYEIVDEPDVAVALDLTVMYGADFYAADWVRPVFATPGMSGPDKLQFVAERVRRGVPTF